MYTRCFEKETEKGIETLNIGEYSFEYYINNNLKQTGLVDDYFETINDLMEYGWEEVV